MVGDIVEDTISAIATALGEGAIGIVRLSGSESLSIVKKLFSPMEKLGLLSARKMLYGFVYDEAGATVDEVLCVYMPAPHSYTGEDVVELQCHGGIAALQAVLALTYKAGARPAEPGEFTKRAFLHKRIDLVQAEAVMDIIEARSKEALTLALRQQKGQLSALVKSIRRGLKDLTVHLEAVIDYPEEDIEDVTYAETAKTILAARAAIDELLSHSRVGRIMREGLRTAIVGRPNVGKSSLLNSLLQEERAIVSEIPGTTRDIIQEQMLIEGVPLVLADTAGIRASKDFVEQIGVRKTRELLSEAELAVVVLDGSQPLMAEDEEVLNAIEGREYVIIVNKADLPLCIDLDSLRTNYGQERVLLLSAKTTSGVVSFIAWLKAYVYGHGGSVEKGIFVQRERQKRLLEEASTSLLTAQSAVENHIPYDCIIIDLREALQKLGEITGESVPGEIINAIFAKFCVGK